MQKPLSLSLTHWSTSPFQALTEMGGSLIKPWPVGAGGPTPNGIHRHPSTLLHVLSINDQYVSPSHKHARTHARQILTWLRRGTKFGRCVAVEAVGRWPRAGKRTNNPAALLCFALLFFGLVTRVLWPRALRRGDRGKLSKTHCDFIWYSTWVVGRRSFLSARSVAKSS